MSIRVAVAGASGYAGGELLRLLAGHPQFELVTATAHSQAGQRVDRIHPQLVGMNMTTVATDAEALSNADLVFLALPHGESKAIAAQLPERVKIVDLGNDHRNADGWTYGLPELSRRRIALSNNVANTGCYAVATILALAPLVQSGLVSPLDVVVVAASGTSGAGKTPQAHLLGSEVMGDLTPYKVGMHQHVPEIKQATGAETLSFTPVLAPMPRGILATVTAIPVSCDATANVVRAVLADAYEAEPFVHVLPDGVWPRTAATAGSNSCHLQAAVDSDSGRIIVVSAIDNLGKGAAGQAVQNANIMFGLPETSGLSVYGVAP